MGSETAFECVLSQRVDHVEESVGGAVRRVEKLEGSIATTREELVALRAEMKTTGRTLAVIVPIVTALLVLIVNLSTRPGEAPAVNARSTVADGTRAP